MRDLFCKFKILLLIVSMAPLSLFGLVACQEKTSPYHLMIEFCQSYGISDTVFSPSLTSGDEGYADEKFFETVYGETPEYVSDYAVVFLSSLDFAGECALFLCYSEYDALVACDIFRRRVALIKSVGSGVDTSYVSDAVIFKSDRYVVMCALDNNDEAKRLWRKIL